MGFALSSVIIHSGRTTVLCSVCHQEGVPRWRKDQGKGWLSAEYRLLPGSTPERQNRELLKLSGRTQEIQRLGGRSLRWRDSQTPFTRSRLQRRQPSRCGSQ